MKTIQILAVGCLVPVLFVGCAIHDDSNVAGNVESETQSQALEGQSALDIIGSWESESGTIYRIEFTTDPSEDIRGSVRGKRFSATVDNGIRCVRAPCPSETSFNGVYRLRGKAITLSAIDHPTPDIEQYFGVYRTSIDASGRLSLVKRGAHEVNAVLRRSTSEPYCVTYQAKAMDGTPARVFYAANAQTYDAAKNLLSLAAPVTQESIEKGACSTPVMCTMIYRPVCGGPENGERTVFGNACQFMASIRDLAGSSGQASGTWEEGACREPYCVTYDMPAQADKSSGSFYAVNVGSFDEGQDILASVTATATSTNVQPGACAAPTACTREYRPVCGSLPGAAPRTFGNACSFRATIKDLARSNEQAAGNWTVGACAPQTCSQDSDCANGFCGWNASRQRVCKPSATQGQSCGGFVLPEGMMVCAPGLNCVYPEPTHDVPGTCQ